MSHSEEVDRKFSAACLGDQTTVDEAPDVCEVYEIAAAAEYQRLGIESAKIEAFIRATHDRRVEHFRQVICGTTGTVLDVARDLGSGCILGYCESGYFTRYDNRHVPCIDGLYSREQRCGIGSMLLIHSLGYYVGEYVYLRAVEGSGAITFYGKHGFRKTGANAFSTSGVYDGMSFHPYFMPSVTKFGFALPQIEMSRSSWLPPDHRTEPDTFLPRTIHHFGAAYTE